MSEEATTAPQPDQPVGDAVVEQQPASQQEPAAPETGGDLAAELAKWKAMARKNEEAAKRNAEAAKAYNEYQESQKSEAEKAQAEIAKLQAEVQERDLLILRSKVAADKGLVPELAKTLTGATAEEMAEDADRLLAAIHKQYVPKSKPTPEQTGAGATGNTLAQQIAFAESKGDFATSMALKNRAVLEARK